jgi:hypothetical protein
MRFLWGSLDKPCRNVRLVFLIGNATFGLVLGALVIAFFSSSFASLLEVPHLILALFANTAG